MFIFVLFSAVRYCLDTKCDKFDWRRKALEACYECKIKSLHLKAVCLSCARNCLANYNLRPIIRSRKGGDKCDCSKSGMCVSRWNVIRAHFDKYTAEDNCIGPCDIKQLLKTIRAPYPVDTADVEDALLCLAEGKEDVRFPRIKPVPFEKWYRRYYDEKEEGVSDEEEEEGTEAVKPAVDKTAVKGTATEGATVSTARTGKSTASIASVTTAKTGKTGYTTSSWQVVDVVKSKK